MAAAPVNFSGSTNTVGQKFLSWINPDPMVDRVKIQITPSGTTNWQTVYEGAVTTQCQTDTEEEEVDVRGSSEVGGGGFGLWTDPVETVTFS
jgi:hypothetical protein